MASIERIPVNGAVLKWARESVGLDSDTAAARVRVKASTLAEWEANDRCPTVNQLRKLASAYSRPFAALCMPAPPVGELEEPLPDYRRSSVRTAMDPAALQKAIVRVRRQRADLVEIGDALGTPATDRLPSFSFSPTATAEQIGAQLRDLLKLSTISASIRSRPGDLLRVLVGRAEELGVVVTQVQSVRRSVMRGFSLGDGEFPIVALNGADWPRGKLFTLFHELVHVGLHSSGLCDLEQETDSSIERLCDAAAASALMPAADFRRLAKLLSRPLTLDQASAIGNEFGASGEAAMLRLRSLGLATWDEYFAMKPDFDAAYAQHKDDEKAASSPDAPIYYQLKVRDLGRSYIRQVLRAYGEDVLSSRDLAVMLEVKFDKVPRLAAQVGEIA